MKQSKRCQCFDPGCKMGHDGQCKERGSVTLYRVDMDDNSGTLFCDGCGEDASASGLFTWAEDDADDDGDELASLLPSQSSRSTLEAIERRWAKGGGQ